MLFWLSCLGPNIYYYALFWRGRQAVWAGGKVEDENDEDQEEKECREK